MTFEDDLTRDEFLGGRLLLRQPRTGHRAGHDAILLAAATPARAGDHVVEFGAGIGTAALALAARVPGIALTLIEIDTALAALARRNAQDNGLKARVEVADIGAAAAVFSELGLGADRADVIMMNPPYNQAGRLQPSPDPARRLAHEAEAGTLETWVHAARRMLRPGGTLSLIWRAEGLDEVLQHLARGFGGVMILPVYPQPGRPAIRVLVRAVKGGRAPLTVCPGLCLRNADSAPSVEAEAILRGGAALSTMAG